MMRTRPHISTSPIALPVFCPKSIRRASNRVEFRTSSYSNEDPMPKAFPVRAALLFFLLIVISILVFSTFSHARAQAAADKHYVIEYYYKTRWDHAEEFITLFRKNHFPVLKKEME